MARKKKPSQPSKQEESSTFPKISTDVLLMVFDHLDIKHRTRFERVNKTWADALRLIWRRAHRLKIGSGPIFEFEECNHRQHHFLQRDSLVDSSDSVLSSRRLSFKILKKCPNLTTVHFGSHPMVTQFGGELYKYCPFLEHVSFKDALTFVAFKPYVEAAGSNCRITCLIIDNDDDDLSRVEECLAQKIESFAEFCPQLDTFVNLTETNNSQLASSIISRVKDLRVGTFLEVKEEESDEVIRDTRRYWRREVLKKAMKLESFSYFDKLSDVDIILLSNLPKLTTVNLVFDDSALFVLNSDIFQQWSSVSIDTGDRNLPFDKISRYLSRNGRYLKFLRLVQISLTPGELSSICQWCPHLEKLELVMDDAFTFNDACTASISSLRKLRILTLCHVIFTDNQFQSIITNLYHLRELHLYNIRLCQEMRNFMESLFRSRNSQLCVYLDYNIRPSDVDFMKVSGNVVYFYSH